jgi:hypothetical protein
MRRTGQMWSSVRVRRIGAAAVLALAVGGVLAVSGIAGTGESGQPAPAGFRLVDGSAGCAYGPDGTVACRAAGAPSAVVLEPDGDSRSDDREVGWDATTPVLLPGESWWNGDVSCRAGEGEIECAAGTGTIRIGSEGAAAASAFFDEQG